MKKSAKGLTVLSAIVLMLGLVSCGASMNEKVSVASITKDDTKLDAAARDKAVSDLVAKASAGTIAAPAGDNYRLDLSASFEDSSSLETSYQYNADSSEVIPSYLVTSTSGTVTSSASGSASLKASLTTDADKRKNLGAYVDVSGKASVAEEGTLNIFSPFVEINADGNGSATSENKKVSYDVSGSVKGGGEVSDQTYVNASYGYQLDKSGTKTSLSTGLVGHADQKAADLFTLLGISETTSAATLPVIPANVLSELQSVVSGEYSKYYTIDVYQNSKTNALTFSGYFSAENILALNNLDAKTLLSDVHSKMYDGKHPIFSSLFSSVLNSNYAQALYYVLQSPFAAYAKVTLPTSVAFNTAFAFNSDGFPISFGIGVDLSGASVSLDHTESFKDYYNEYTSETASSSESSASEVELPSFTYKLNAKQDKSVFVFKLGLSYGDSVQAVTLSEDEKKAALAGTDYTSNINSFFGSKRS
jgi:hypothetical protein